MQTVNWWGSAASRRTSRPRIVICSRFKKLLTLIGEKLERERLTCVRLDGDTKDEEREKVVEMFNDPDSEVSIFLLSLGAGGVGLNLQAANVMILADPWWNPAVSSLNLCVALLSLLSLSR